MNDVKEILKNGEKPLHLNLKKKWFDMILSGEKKEEYRERKKYWFTRLFCNMNGYRLRKFDTIIFSNGYRKNRPQFTMECKGVVVDKGKVEWGAEPRREYFVIMLGKILDIKTKED